MLKTFNTRGLGAGSFFKILYIGNFVWLLIATAIAGLMAWLLPHSAAAVEEHQYALATGPLGLLIMFVLSPIWALIVSFFQWISIGLGFWIWTRFRHVCLTVSVVDECCDKNDGQCY